MKFTLEIELGNGAIITDHDVRQALHETAYKMRISSPPEDGDNGIICDENGTPVGKWEVIDAPADPIERMYAEAFADDDSKRLCECGRLEQDCIAFDNGDSSQHGDR